jgi:hypothetical protein
MKRARVLAAATVVAAGLLGVSVFAQQAPDLKPVLAGKKFVPPIMGVADLQILQPVTKREKDLVITTIKVKNVSNAPIARLAVSETWYDAKNQVVTGGKGSINGLLQPGEIKEIRIETPYNAAMRSNNWNFTHANGDVKPKKVAKLEGDDTSKKEPATKTASKKK